MGHPTLENETPFAFDMMGLADEEGLHDVRGLKVTAEGVSAPKKKA